jgi:transposase InsO family protein
MRSELVDSALDMALGTPVPARNMLHHTDQGSQYSSASYREKLAALGIQVSMSRRGNCYDDAFVESFNGTLKQELVHPAPHANSNVYCHLTNSVSTKPREGQCPLFKGKVTRRSWPARPASSPES